MKRNKAVGLFLMIIIIFQALYFLNDESLHLYSFAVGINRESKDAMDIITMAVFSRSGVFYALLFQRNSV